MLTHTTDTGSSWVPRAPRAHGGTHFYMGLMVLPRTDTRDQEGEQDKKGEGDE